MALLGSDFNPTTPRDTDPVADGAAEIRDLKRRVKDFVSVKFDPETGQFKSASSNITLASSDPTNPNLGDVYFNTATLTAYVFTTGGWEPILRSAIPFAQQFFSASGSFTVPAGVYRLQVHAWGGGGGGSHTDSGVPGNGGGSGGFGKMLVAVAPAQVIAFTVGTGGLGSTVDGTAGADGVNTTFLTLTAGKGFGAPRGNVHSGGAGGTVTGADFSISGGAGGGGINLVSGYGGDAPQGGPGGAPVLDGSLQAYANGDSPGGGGAGGIGTGPLSGGNGSAGGILIEY